MLKHLIRSAFLSSIVAAPIAPAQDDTLAAAGGHDEVLEAAIAEIQRD